MHPSGAFFSLTKSLKMLSKTGIFDYNVRGQITNGGNSYDFIMSEYL